MTNRKPGHRGDGFAGRVALFYAALFAFVGMHMPYLPIWLETKGLNTDEIGLVLATGMAARPAIVPVVMRVVDHFGWTKGALVAASWIACATFVAVALSDGFAAIILAYAVAALPQAVVLPLAEAYALRGLAARERAYGPVRLWGSVAFIGANLGGGLLLDRLGAANIAWILVAALAATAWSATALVPLAPGDAETAPPQAGKPALWRAPAFVAVVAAASLIQASHAVLYGFASLQWAAKGLDGPVIGALWGIGVFAEIGLFAASSRFTTRWGPLELIGLGAVGALVRWTAMAFDPPAVLLPWLQCLHGLSFGATHLGAMHFLARFAARQSAVAQGDYSTVVAVVSAVEMGLAGVLVGTFEEYAYLAMAASAAVGGAIVVGARRLGVA